MLPIIDLHATDLTALYSLLLFVEKQGRNLNVALPCATFDQQLYTKAYEIASLMKMNVFLLLGGFNQLMSFLGSISSLMEEGGLRSALETAFASVAVRHIFFGKAYSRAIRGHFLSTSRTRNLILMRKMI